MSSQPPNSADDVVRGVIGVLRRADRFLLIRRGNVERAPFQWCFPGGTIEPGEAEDAALVRELREELYVECAPVERLFEQTKHSGRLVLAWWLARLISGEPRANPAEVAELAWLTPAEVRGLRDVISGTEAVLEHYGL
ncbi:MAG: NUDIX domain-containing protein [Phycisphaerae bacterium]